TGAAVFRRTSLDVRGEPNNSSPAAWWTVSGRLGGQDESVIQHTLDRRSAWKGEELEELVADGAIPNLVPEVWPGQEERVAVAEAIADLYQPSHWIGLLILGGALAAIWGIRDPSRRPVLVPLGVVIGLGFCTIAINDAYPQYRYPLDPLLHIVAAAGLFWTILAGNVRVRLVRVRAQRWAHSRPVESGDPSSIDPAVAAHPSAIHTAILGTGPDPEA
ncbi:MAG: hypothetical protein AB7F99_19480, partial [Vicinamibacterales bacterium]